MIGENDVACIWRRWGNINMTAVLLPFQLGRFTAGTHLNYRAYMHAKRCSDVTLRGSSARQGGGTVA
jgi:hypothetical protein